MTNSIAARVRQLRICLAHHSFIYYTLGHTVIGDGQWDLWAAELVELQAEHGSRFDPKYDRWFRGWDGNTGYGLCSIPGLKEQVAKTHPELTGE